MTPLPRVVRIEPAGSCNLRCTHCPTGTGSVGEVGVMRRETFAAVLARVVRPLSPLRAAVLYHGGEPLLCGHLEDMVCGVRPFAQFVKTTTNGTLITAYRARRLAECGFDEIEVSLDGNSAEENDAIRVGSAFVDIARNVRTLLDECDLAGRRTCVAVTSTGVRGHGPPTHLLATFARDLHRLRIRVQPLLVWPAHGPKAVRPPDAAFCDHVISTVTVRWNGDVVPCCYDLASGAIMGNVLRDDLEAIWAGDRFESFRAAIARRDPPALCRGCRVLYAGGPT